MKEYLSQISGIKKNKEMEKEERKLKTKNVSKITIGDEQEHLVQSTDRARAVQAWYRKNLFTKTWHLAIYISKYVWKWSN